MKMKRIIRLCILFTITILGISCSNSASFNGDEEKVKNVTTKCYKYPAGTMNFTEIKLIRNITVQDSINYFLKYSDEIINDHDAAVQKLNTWIGQKESKAYSDWDVDTEIKRWTEELHRYVDAYDGKAVSESWPHEYVYRKLYEFRQMDSNKVLGKIYTITYTQRGSKPITDIRSFDAEITKSIASYAYIEAVQQPASRNLEKIHFKRYNSNSTNEELQEATFIKEGGDIKEFDENGNPVK
jgi:hypothetical protein